MAGCAVFLIEAARLRLIHPFHHDSPDPKSDHEQHEHNVRMNGTMLKIAAIVLLLLWALRLVSGQTFGGYLHVLLVLALLLWMITVVRGANVIWVGAD